MYTKPGWQERKYMLKKFMTKSYKELILEHANKPMKEQKKIFNDTFYKWKADEIQLDDILIIGISL